MTDGTDERYTYIAYTDFVRKRENQTKKGWYIDELVPGVIVYIHKV